MFSNAFLDFNYVWKVESIVEAELQKYESRGILINSDMEYRGSPIETLEHFVLDKVTAIKNYMGKDMVQSDDNFAKLFFAIVAPSMTGKTQAAFTFKELRPLYFLLFGKPIDTAQDIYKNFYKLSKTFRNFIAEDFKKLKKLNEIDEESPDIFDQISSSSLLQDHLDTKFKTLGFIYSMIEHANENFNRNGNNAQTWMNFYTTSPRNITVEAKSLLDLENFDTGRYVLFFDEFKASEANAFVRNLFRTAKFPVFVANTNSNVANLVGKSTTISRENGTFAWSLAVIALNSMNKDILYKMHHDLENNINNLIQRGSNDKEKQLIRSFFVDFLDRQLKHLRPGFADIIATEISAISNQSSTTISNQSDFTLNNILVAMVEELSKKITSKKRTVRNKSEGILGSLALFLNNAYLSMNQLDEKIEAKMSHLKSYIQYHFYYLINPVDVNKWCFLAYRPQSDGTDLSLFYGGKFYKDWTVEFTYFKEEEMIPFFACQSIISSISIPEAMKTGLKIANANPNMTGSAPNTSQRVSLDGNHLEVIASTCIIEASQHKVGDSKSAFTGQDGISFLTNLIGNLIEADNFRRKDKVGLDCFIINEFLKRFHIPFLFPGGMKLPDFFKNNLSSFEGSVNFGEYARTTNHSQIDGFFKYFIKNNIEAKDQACAVECKNWSENVLAYHLIPILKKANSKSANFSLLFCNSLGHSKDDTLENFVSVCQNPENKFLVLKLKKTSLSVNSFQLIHYCPGLPKAEDASLICVIIELDLINSGISE